MILRIELTEDNSTVTKIFDSASSGSDSGDASSGSNGGNPSSADMPEVVFTLSPASLDVMSDYDNSRYSHPVTNIDIDVPEADRAVIASWLGNATPSSSPSATLVSRMTAAVTGAIRSYITAASARSLFTSPLRIGYGIMAQDGAIIAVSPLQLLIPNSMAPQMLIREPDTSGNRLRTVTEILNTPASLYVSVSKFNLALYDGLDIRHLVIFATRQCPLLSGNETVSAIRTVELYGDHVPCWSYNRVPEDLVRQQAEADGDFRIIAQIPIEEAANGVAQMRLPANLTDLNDWNSLPKVGEIDSDGRVPVKLILETDALDLGYPEEFKRVRGVTVRGIFDRRDTDDRVKLTLFGSHHRDRWRILATSRGAHIRFLRSVKYRWYRVKVEAPYPAMLDALTFEFERAKHISHIG